MKLLLLALFGLAAADNWQQGNQFGHPGNNIGFGGNKIGNGGFNNGFKGFNNGFNPGFNNGFNVKPNNPFGVKRNNFVSQPSVGPTKVVNPSSHGGHGFGGHGFGGHGNNGGGYGTVFDQKKGPVVNKPQCYGPHCNQANFGHGNGNVGHGNRNFGVNGFGVRKPVANRGCPNPNGYGFQKIVNPCGYGKFCAPQGYGRICCPAPTCALQGYRVAQNKLPISVLSNILDETNNIDPDILSGLETAAAGDAASGDVFADSNDAFLGTSGASLYPDDCCNICWRDASCRGVSYIYVTKEDHKSFAVCIYLKGYGKNSYLVDNTYYKQQFNQNNEAGLKVACLTANKATAVSHNPHGFGGHNSFH